jgi:hypothetical protein
MPDVKTGSGRIRKHVEAVKLGFREIIGRAERPMLFPIGLPFGLDSQVIVRFAHSVVGGRQLRCDR